MLLDSDIPYAHSARARAKGSRVGKAGRVVWLCRGAPELPRRKSSVEGPEGSKQGGNMRLLALLALSGL